MATRAEQFKVKTQRAANPSKAKAPKRPRRDVDVDTSLPGVSETNRKVGAGSTAGRNKSARAEKKGGAALEDSATGKASRKSTRKSVGRAKRTTNLARKAVRKTRSAKSRATKAATQDSGAEAKTRKPASRTRGR